MLDEIKLALHFGKLSIKILQLEEILDREYPDIEGQKHPATTVSLARQKMIQIKNHLSKINDLTGVADE